MADLDPLVAVEATLVAVEVIITRADGTVEHVPLDLAAYKTGRIEPTVTLANSESISIVADYA